MAFNRSKNSGSRRGEGFRPRFNDRGRVEMHRAICDNCGKECEVPFRPTSGKPVFCSNCFENQSGGSDRSTNFEERMMFEAVCDECGNSCKVPFRPSSKKPIYCGDCFGDKKSGGSRNTQFEALNSKLDRILNLLSPVIPTEEVVIEEVVEKPIKIAKKKS